MSAAAFVTAPFAPVPVTLEGQRVRLEPLTMAHAEGLLAAGHHASLWTVTVQPPLSSIEAVAAYVALAADNVVRGDEVPFAIVERGSGVVVGSTRWMDIARAHRRVEIGGTWLTPRVQGTLVNTEAKYLQLVHLFDVLGAVRVQFKTDLRNTQSQRALEKLGATREGVLRRHMGVKRRLAERLMAGAE